MQHKNVSQNIYFDLRFVWSMYSCSFAICHFPDWKSLARSGMGIFCMVFKYMDWSACLLQDEISSLTELSLHSF